MAEVNAFSIDGTKYALTATDQTYVGETGLAQLGLDYDSSPGDCEDALADAGGGRLIISGRDVTDDGWATDSIADGGRCILDMLCTPRPDDNGHMCSLMAYGVTHVYGTYQRAHDNSDGEWDTGWTTLVYGAGDTWSPDVGYDCIGEFGSSSSGYFYFTIPLPAVAPGVSSVSVTAAGTCYVRDASGTIATVASTSKFSSAASATGIGPAHARLRVSGLSGFEGYSVGTIYLSSNFTIKFS